MSWISMRHSGEKRPPTEAHRTGPEGQAASHLSPDRAEALAAKIVAVGSDYITHKTEERFTPSEVSEGPTFMPVDAMANKLMKEAAREMERQEGIVAPGSDAALAQSVFRHKDEPTAPQHIVAEKVRERVAAAEEHALHPTFVGVDPDAGRPNNQKMRHFRGAGNDPYLKAAFRNEKNPDVIKD